MNATILYVEDELTTRLLVVEALRNNGYDVQALTSAEEASASLERLRPDLVVLDWVLPGESGLDLLKRWRAAGLSTPVILLSGRDTVEHRVEGLEAGANDYMIKPFAVEELLARVAVQLRDRARQDTTVRLSDGYVDLVREVVVRDNNETRLTTLESKTLAYLFERAGKTVERGDLLRDVWGFRNLVRTRAVDNTISRLRGKIESDPVKPRHIITVHGIGYRFEP